LQGGIALAFSICENFLWKNSLGPSRLQNFDLVILAISALASMVLSARWIVFSFSVLGWLHFVRCHSRQYSKKTYSRRCIRMGNGLGCCIWRMLLWVDEASQMKTIFLSAFISSEKPCNCCYDQKDCVINSIARRSLSLADRKCSTSCPGKCLTSAVVVILCASPPNELMVMLRSACFAHGFLRNFKNTTICAVLAFEAGNRLLNRPSGTIHILAQSQT
jgi:hypothetical protein